METGRPYEYQAQDVDPLQLSFSYGLMPPNIPSSLKRFRSVIGSQVCMSAGFHMEP